MKLWRIDMTHESEVGELTLFAIEEASAAYRAGRFAAFGWECDWYQERTDVDRPTADRLVAMAWPTLPLGELVELLEHPNPVTLAKHQLDRIVRLRGKNAAASKE